MKKLFSIIFTSGKVLFLIFFLNIGACQQKDAAIDLPTYIKSKYDFKFLAYEGISNEIKTSLYIPFLENEVYCFSDYDGNKITNTYYEDIILIGIGDFYWAKKKDFYKLYKFPDQLMWNREFTDKRNLPPMKIENQNKNGTLLSFLIDTTYITKKTEITSTENSELEALHEIREEHKLVGKYYLHSTSTSPIEKIVYAPVNPINRRSKLIRETKHTNSYSDYWNESLSYLIVWTSNDGFNVINEFGQLLFDEDFWDIKPLTSSFLVGFNESGKQALVDINRKKVTAYKYDKLEKSFCNNLFYGSLEDDSGFQLFVLGQNGSAQKIFKKKDYKCFFNEYVDVSQSNGMRAILNSITGDTIFKDQSYYSFISYYGKNGIEGKMSNTMISFEGDTISRIQHLNKLNDDLYFEIKEDILGFYNADKKLVNKFNNAKVYFPQLQKNKKYIQILSENKSGLIDDKGNEILKPIYDKFHHIEEIGWVLLEVNGKNGIYSVGGNWVMPLEERKIIYMGKVGQHPHVFQLVDRGYRCYFNDKLEIIFEQSKVFVDQSNFNWNEIPIDQQPKSAKLSSAPILLPFQIYSSKTTSYVFDWKGNFYSLHKGKYDADFSLTGLIHNSEKNKMTYVPIGLFKDGSKKYYVRLTDGFEYFTEPK